MALFRGTTRGVGVDELRPRSSACPDISVSEIVSSVLIELTGSDVRALLEECARRAAIAARQEASRRTLGAASVSDAWHDIIAINVEGE